MLIEEAILTAPEHSRAIGESLYKNMMISAELLDTALDPASGEKPTPQSVTVKRDEFHKTCRDIGEWLSKHAPDVKLEWN